MKAKFNAEQMDQSYRRGVDALDSMSRMLEAPAPDPDDPMTAISLIDEATQKPTSQATVLIEIGRRLDLFHNADGDHYAALQKHGHREVWALRSKPIKEWLQHGYFKLTGKGCNGQALNDALDTLGAMARFTGTQRDVNYRVAVASDGAIYIDLGTKDWIAIEITPQHWQLVTTPPVMLTRTPKTLPLPLPVRSGRGFAQFQALFHLDDRQTLMIIAWMLAALRGVRPFPVLILEAEQGSGKSTLARAIKSLTDPATNALRSPPKDETDLATAAANCWVLSVDNLSGISPGLSDAICRVSTGGSISTRKLYTDGEEYSVEITRPVILNGIDELPTRPDLLDRSLIISLKQVAEDQRRTESDLRTEFERIRPEVFGDLLTATQTALANIATTTLDRLPRMADFALWVVAAEPALPGKPGDFIEYYRQDISNHAADAVASSSFGTELLRYLEARGGYEGNAYTLLTQLNQQIDDRDKNKYWPTSGKGASNQVRRLAPALRKLGFKVEFIRTRLERIIHIMKMPKTPSQPSQPSLHNATDVKTKTLGRDGCDDSRDGTRCLPSQPSHSNSDRKAINSNSYGNSAGSCDGSDGCDGKTPLSSNDELVL